MSIVFRGGGSIFLYFIKWANDKETKSWANSFDTQLYFNDTKAKWQDFFSFTANVSIFFRWHEQNCVVEVEVAVSLFYGLAKDSVMYFYIFEAAHKAL